MHRTLGRPYRIRPDGAGARDREDTQGDELVEPGCKVVPELPEVLIRDLVIRLKDELVDVRIALQDFMTYRGRIDGNVVALGLQERQNAGGLNGVAESPVPDNAGGFGRFWLTVGVAVLITRQLPIDLEERILVGLGAGLVPINFKLKD